MQTCQKCYTDNMKKGRASNKLIIGFFAIIILGGIILFLPISTEEGHRLSLIDSMFISASALCVTGLTPVDISVTLSMFGRVVLAILIQVGGMGFATFAVFFLLLLRQNVSFSQRNLAQEALNQETGRGIVSLVKFIFIASGAIEIIGAAVLAAAFAATGMKTSTSIGMGVFHSISAFNNAGFDLFGNSFCDYSSNAALNITISSLIILGGIGFFVMDDILHGKRWRKLSFHTKIVLFVTLCLIIGGGLVIKATSPELTWMESFFLSISSRTAGFNSVDTGSLTVPATMAVIVLMFIGASPGSTGGGIKTSTFFTVLIAVRHVIAKRETSAFRRRISKDSILKAFSVMTLFLFASIIAVFLICAVETGLQFMDVLFEVVSAIGTVGLSRGITGKLGAFSKTILIMVMFIGRLGPLTIVSSLSSEKQNPFLHCVEERVIIG